MSNIAEGFERGTPKEFHRALTTSKGSVGEVRSLLYLARDIGYLNTAQFDALHLQATEVARVIGGLRAAAQRRVAAASTKTRRGTHS
jgi:four helix bundle protein